MWLDWIRRFARNIGVNRVVLALSLARLGDAMGNSVLFVVIPLYVAALPAPWFPFAETVRVGLLLAVYGVISAIAQPFAGALSDRLGRQKILIVAGLFVMGAATASFVLASRYADLLLLRSFQGVGVALTIPTSLALMTAATQTETRGGAMGVYSTTRVLGFGAGPLIGGYLYDRLGFDAVFYTGAVLVFFGMALVYLFVQDVHREDSQDGPRGNRGSGAIFDWGLVSASLLALGFATFVMAAASSMMVTLEKQFNARLGISAFVFSLAFSTLILGRLLFQIPLGWLSDKVGRKPLILSGLLVLAPATAVLPLAGTALGLVGVRFLQGVASAGIAAPAFALAGDLSSSQGVARQMSIVTIGYGLGLALGPLVAGLLAPISFELPFWVNAAVTLIAAGVVFMFVTESRRRGRDTQ